MSIINIWRDLLATFRPQLSKQCTGNYFPLKFYYFFLPSHQTYMGFSAFTWSTNPSSNIPERRLTFLSSGKVKVVCYSPRRSGPNKDGTQGEREWPWPKLWKRRKDSSMTLRASGGRRHLKHKLNLKTQTKFPKLGMILLTSQTTYFTSRSWIVAFLQSTFCLAISILYLPASLLATCNLASILSILLKLHSWRSPLKTWFLCTMVCSRSQPPWPICTILHCWPSPSLKQLYTGSPF